MNILEAGLDMTTRGFLRTSGIIMLKTEDALTAENLFEWVDSSLCEAIVLNIDLPGFGLYTPRVLRNKKFNTPLIGVAATTKESEPWSERRALFLEQGGDDLLQIPVSPRELLASLRASARRFKGSLLDIIVSKLDGVTIIANEATRGLTVNGVGVTLTTTEHQIFSLLARSPGRIRNRNELLEVMGDGVEVEDRTIDSHIKRIRMKFKKVHPKAGDCIRTVYGGGYAFSEDAAVKIQQR